MYKLFVIGIADPSLTPAQEQLLKKCSLVVGTGRLSEMTAHLSLETCGITPLDSAFDTIRKRLRDGNVAVLASGDPLFYGIGRRLLAEFPEGAVQIIPALSSLQRACALFGISWDDARIISLHGRQSNHIPGLLLQNRKTLVLTDPENSPDRISRRILDYLKLIGATEPAESIEVLVAQDLGLETQKLFSADLDTTSRSSFSSLNIMCLRLPKSHQCPVFRLGLTEEELYHSRGLITKNEVRAATLHRLQLPWSGVFWDIGAGSGSISIEAARANPELVIYAIEHKQEELENIKKNIVKFRCYNILPIFGRAPEALAQLPAPDRVFVGGSSGALPSIVELLDGRLAENGRVVVNGVIDKTIEEAPVIMKEHGFRVASSVIKVSRTEPDGRTLDFNPITIMTGTR